MTTVPGYYTVRETAIKLRLHYEYVNHRIYLKQCIRRKLEQWPSVLINGRRLIPKEFVDKLTPLAAHRKPPGRPKKDYRVKSSWKGRKTEEAAARLKEMGLPENLLEPITLPNDDLEIE
jgi:hypothetical protein